MNTKIRDYINKLFQDSPKTKKALEMKEEMIANAEEKFNDLVAEGYRDEDAFAVVIHSIGNVEELFKELENKDMGGFGLTEQEMKLLQKRAKITAISVGMYIFAGATFFFFAMLDDSIRSQWDYSTMGLVIAAILCILPTILIVYVSLLTPKYRKAEDSMVEEYKEWKNDRSRNKDIRVAVSCIIWSITVVVYILASFLFSIWHISWVLFLIAICVEAIVQICFSMKNF